MIAIVDGGSTKCDWVILNDQLEEVSRTKTLGFNPNIIDSYLIGLELEKNDILKENQNNIKKIYFYGAGCGIVDNQAIVKRELENFFPNSEAFVKEDLLAAAYAAYQGKPAIVCILGTGSNSCYFDGKEIKRLLPSLGYLAGDEGSGGTLGKELIRNYFMKKLPPDLDKQFDEVYNLSHEDLMQKMYHNPHVSAYLASFNSFIAERKSHPYFLHMIYKEMKKFFSYHVIPYAESRASEINFIGSIAHVYEDILRSVAADYHFTIGTIVQRPIDNLVDYHKKYILI